VTAMSVYHPLLEGAIDLHVHSSPSVFARKQTDWELVEEVKAAKMAGVVIKSHEAPTTDRTALIRMKEPNLHVYGGLVCNHFVGGLNPSAVEVAIQSGAKIIWMPTISSAEHHNYFANRKTRLFQTARALKRQPPLSVLDENGRLKEEVHEILDLIARADIILATGHLAPQEVLVLVEAAREHRVQKILIQHTDLEIARIPLELERKLVSRGAMVEKCFLALSDDFKGSVTPEEMAESIRVLEAEACVMVTDYGQAHHESPVRALHRFVELMLEHGITECQIRQMIVHNPKGLLGL